MESNSEIELTIGQLLRGVIDKIDEGKEEIFGVLLKNMSLEQIIGSADFGSNKGRKNKERILQSVKGIEVIPNNLLRFSDRNIVDLKSIYNNKKSNTDNIYKLSIIAIGTAVILVLIGFIFVFIFQNKTQMGIITPALSGFSSFLGGTLFFMYRREDSRLKSIEEEIIRFERLKQSVMLVEKMETKKAKTEAYLNLIEFLTTPQNQNLLKE